MTFAELVQEIVDRGYTYVKEPRIEAAVQRAYQRLCAFTTWPFLEDTDEGAAPLTIADLGRVLSVTDPANQESLSPADRRWLASTYPNLSEEGSPQFWYLEGNTLKVFPASSSLTIVVRFQKKPAALTAEAEPLIPAEWQYLIVDEAVADLLKDNDEYAESRALRGDNAQARIEMLQALLTRNQQQNPSIVRTGHSVDYL